MCLSNCGLATVLRQAGKWTHSSGVPEPEVAMTAKRHWL
jgi:hypothetical protein